MPRLISSRLILALSLPLAASTIASGQTPSQPSALPATQPTSVPAAPSQAASTYQPVATATHRARVTWTAGQLAVAADNSSLNQILLDISRQTGLKITGGVMDERVFGTYGPAEPSTVLAALLAGTGSNMLLKQSSGNAPQELVLTPRQGGPTPPSPASARQNDGDQDADLPPQRVRPPLPVAAPPPTNIQSAAQQQNPGQQPSPDTNDQSNSGVRTPQQIYDQLMKLQQQKAAAPPQY